MSTHKAKRTYLQSLRQLVIDESKVARQRIDELWGQSLNQRVARGFAIEQVDILAIKGNELTLGCQENNSRFREGDILCLHRGDPTAQPNVMVSLKWDNETQLRVTTNDPSIYMGEFQQKMTGWILDEGYLDLSQHILQALQDVADTGRGRDHILPLLMGEAEPKTNSSRQEIGHEMAKSDSLEHPLNEKQREALANAYASDSLYLIQGPPGTGKTAVLALLAHAHASDGERVLVTGFTHRAINNALQKCSELHDLDEPLIKIGQASRADGLGSIENFETFDEAQPTLPSEGGYIIGATPFATRSRMSGVEFDTVIFDEASQITLPLAIMGMLRGQKYIFIGDEKQLPPVLQTSGVSSKLSQSIFATLKQHDYESSTMLTTTYRMNATLTAWPSQTFYDKALIADERVADQQLELGKPLKNQFKQLLDPQHSVVFWDLQHKNETMRSRLEADAIADLLAELLRVGVSSDEIGVIAPYRLQGRLIRNKLRRYDWTHEIRDNLIVDTVERMQGQERDVILISMTTSDPNFAASLADFLFQPERLNVSITRARRKLIVVGSSHLLKTKPDHAQGQALVDLHDSFLQTCHTVWRR